MIEARIFHLDGREPLAEARIECGGNVVESTLAEVRVGGCYHQLPREKNDKKSGQMRVGGRDWAPAEKKKKKKSGKRKRKRKAVKEKGKEKRWKKRLSRDGQQLQSNRKRKRNRKRKAVVSQRAARESIHMTAGKNETPAHEPMHEPAHEPMHEPPVVAKWRAAQGIWWT